MASPDHVPGAGGISNHRALQVGLIVAACLLVASGAERVPAREANTFTEQVVLRASDAQPADLFGVSVAISAETAIVGAPREDAGPLGAFADAGAAYVFGRNEGGASNWGQLAKLIAPLRDTGDRFGGSTAISGDTAVVGANREDGGDGDPRPDAGAAYLFGRNQGGVNNWGQVAELMASDTQSGDRFGSSVAISGEQVVVGAPAEDGGDGDPRSAAGAAYVFRFVQGSGWLEAKKLIADDAQSGDNFGAAVGISGDTAIVGAPRESGPGDALTFAGAIYVFQFFEGFGWDQAAKLAAPDAQSGDEFGSSVAISGDTIIVGAPLEDGPGDARSLAGAAYVFQFIEGFGWLDTAKLTASDAQAGDQFGGSVAISGDIAIVGAASESGGSGDPLEDAGAVYVFGRNDGGTENWGEVARLTASDAQANDSFGESVGVSEGTAIIGADGEDGGPGDSISAAGAAYIFRESFLRLFIGHLPKRTGERRLAAPR